MTGALITLPVQMLSKVSRKRGALSGHSVVFVCVFKARLFQLLITAGYKCVPFVFSGIL